MRKQPSLFAFACFVSITALGAGEPERPRTPPKPDKGEQWYTIPLSAAAGQGFRISRDGSRIGISLTTSPPADSPYGWGVIRHAYPSVRGLQEKGPPAALEVGQSHVFLGFTRDNHALVATVKLGYLEPGITVRNILMCRGSRIIVRDLDDNRKTICEVETTSGPFVARPDMEPDLPPLLMSPNAEFLAVGSPGRVELWHLRTGKKLGTVEARDSAWLVSGRLAVFSGDSEYLAVESFPRRGGPEGNRSTVTIVKTRTAQQVGVIHFKKSGLRCMGLSPDGKTLAAAEVGGHRVLLWSTESSELIRELDVGRQYGEPLSLTFSPSGKYLACCCGTPTGDGHSEVWRLLAWDLQKGTLRWVNRGRDCHEFAFSPGERSIAELSAQHQLVPVLDLK